MREPGVQARALALRNARRATMPIILWLLGVPLIVVIVLMFAGVF
jgi:hypothetical protein